MQTIPLNTQGSQSCPAVIAYTPAGFNETNNVSGLGVAQFGDVPLVRSTPPKAKRRSKPKWRKALTKFGVVASRVAMGSMLGGVAAAFLAPTLMAPLLTISALAVIPTWIAMMVLIATR